MTCARLWRLAAIVVAVGSIAACQDLKEPLEVRATTLPDSADQMLIGMRVALTDGGVRRAELRADTALMYDDNARSELRSVNAVFFTPTGVQDATLTSREGTYNIRLGTMQARGDVVVNSTAGRRLTSQELRYDPGRNEVASDSAFRLTLPNGQVMQGVGFISDPDLNSVRVLKDPKASGARVTIPKQ
ncbi:MAG TPA: LPS export ABC transporter periplasmic protein LptC [Gemmatimonadaceae bacterium]|nr:LPS export ABC transporter periplasmic protein LptC [Gemmatimonadaceae bacterium]